jgi:hypothetical protein
MLLPKIIVMGKILCWFGFHKWGTEQEKVPDDIEKSCRIVIQKQNQKLASPIHMVTCCRCPKQQLVIVLLRKGNGE